MVAKRGNIFIGTSNIVVPGNKNSFPEAFKNGSRLKYYASIFNTVEINSSFYKVPLPATFERWSTEVPAGFKFSVKLWRNITHVKDLNFDSKDIPHFLSAVEKLGEKKAPLLVQFPGKINIRYYARVESILKKINSFDIQWPVAVEFRNSDWYVGETLELLDEYNASLVLHDIPKSKNTQLNKKAGILYIRFHGTAGDYRGSYDEAELKKYASLMKQHAMNGKDVYAYFNNTIGAAYDNARVLQKLIK